MHKQLPARIIGTEGPAAYEYLENTTSRNAFWSCWIERMDTSYWFCFRYGKIGTVGLAKSSPKFNGYQAAVAAMNAKRNEKAGGDYVSRYYNQGGFANLSPVPASASKPIPAPVSAQSVKPAQVLPSIPPFKMKPPKEDPIGDALDFMLDT